MKRLSIALLLLSSTLLWPQAWSTFIDPSRAIDWTSVGFAIPSYTVNCATQPSLATGSGSATANTTSIQNSLNSCDATHNVVLIPSGTWYANQVSFGSQGKQVLRGAGPLATDLIFESTGGCAGGIGNQGLCLQDPSGLYNGSAAVLPPSGTQQCLWTAGYAQGTTSITLSSCGGTPPLHKILVLDQANDTTDTTGIYVCQQNNSTPSNCNNDGTGNNNGRVIGGVSYSQQQVTYITGVTSLGGGSYTVTVSPAVYFTNIRSGQSPGAWWPGFVQLMGVENMTLDGSNLSGTISLGQCYQCWIKNVRSLTAGRNHIGIYMSANDVVRDSYFYAAQSYGTSSYGVEFEEASAVLVENNIFQKTVAPIMFGAGTGSVIGYNLSINNFYTGNGANPPDDTSGASAAHNSGNEMNLWEGNVMQSVWADNVWGSSSQITLYRNFLSGFQKMFAPSGTCFPYLCESSATIVRAFDRSLNYVGNVLGQPGFNTVYQTYATSTTAGTGGSEDSAIYSFGWAGGGFGNPGSCGATFCDPLVFSTSMRWDNYDAFNQTVRQNTGEGCSAAVIYINANCTNFTTPTTSLPASLYYSSKPSWWPSAKAWPSVGPDIATGNVSTCNGGTYASSQASSSGQCTGGSLNSTSSTTVGWASHVISIPAQDCYLTTLTGPPDGSGSVLAFDASTCYSTLTTTPGSPTLLMAKLKSGGL